MLEQVKGTIRYDVGDVGVVAKRNETRWSGNENATRKGARAMRASAGIGWLKSPYHVNLFRSAYSLPPPLSPPLSIMASLEDAVGQGAQFVNPFLNDGTLHMNTGLQTSAHIFLGCDIQQKQDHLSKILLENAPVDGEEYGREGLVEKALACLREIHNADRASPKDSPYDGTLVAVVYGLIDVVVLQGIVPSICAAARSTRRPETVLIPVAAKITPKNIPLLMGATKSLCAILSEGNSGISPLIRDRALADIIFGAAELAYSPDVDSNLRRKSLELYDTLLSKYVHPLITS